MKSLKLLFAITLPLIVTFFSSAAAIAQQRSANYGQTCWTGKYGYLWSQEADSPINIRDEASVQSHARHIGYKGNAVQVLNRTPSDDGYCWFRVKFAQSGATGWVRGDFIVDGEENYTQ